MLRYEIQQQTVAEHSTVYSMDISENDKIHDHWSSAFMTKLYDYFGLNKIVNEILDSLNDRWQFNSGVFKAEVVGCLQSGRADTLCKNSFCDLFMTLASVCSKGVDYILFQGDDVTIIAQSVTILEDSPFYKHLKLETNVVGSAVGFLVRETLTLDIYNVALKILNRNYYNEENLNKIKDYQIAIQDRLSLINTLSDYEDFCTYNAIFHGIDIPDVEYIFQQCYNFATSQVEEVRDMMVLKNKYPLTVI